MNYFSILKYQLQMRVHFTDLGWESFLSWSDDVETKVKIENLIEYIRRDPFKGIGKPEPLQKPLSRCWSRRINQKDRLIYRVDGKSDDQHVTIIQCRGHY